MSEFKDDTFLSRWINNELSEEELNAFKESEEYGAYKRIIEGANLIQSENFDREELLEKIKSERKNHIPKRNTRWIFAAAASIVLIIGFFAYNILSTSGITSYQTKVGQKLSVSLPDGSEVILNANSELSYSPDNWDDARTLTLKGEGYFKVMKGKQFQVKTTSGNVTVLGTEFTIKELDDFFEVMCFEGSVKVSSLSEEEILKPKTSVRKFRNSNLMRRNILTDQPAWLMNKSTFTSVPIGYVLIELKNQYGLQFEGADIIEDQSFNGTFPHDNLDLALKIVLDPLSVNYEKKDNVIVFSRN